MVLAFSLHERYSWVLLVGVGTGWLTTYQTMNVSKFRKLAGIHYPQAYAEKDEVALSPAAKKFNCAQRAHQNTIDVLPQTILYLLFSGIKYPTTAAALGATWVLGRFIYTIGYSSGDPSQRNIGFVHGIAYMGLQGLSTWTALELAWTTWEAT